MDRTQLPLAQAKTLIPQTLISSICVDANSDSAPASTKAGLLHSGSTLEILIREYLLNTFSSKRLEKNATRKHRSSKSQKRGYLVPPIPVTNQGRRQFSPSCPLSRLNLPRLRRRRAQDKCIGRNRRGTSLNRKPASILLRPPFRTRVCPPVVTA